MTRYDRWSKLLGPARPALNEADVANLLKKSIADVAAESGFLRSDQGVQSVNLAIQFVPSEREGEP